VSGQPRLENAVHQVNRRSAEMCALVERQAHTLITAGKTPVVLGGDHSTPFGAIRADADAHPGLGILHIDAHADLRAAYEGFEWSHASVMYNVVSKIGARGGVARLDQVGIRDFGEDELRRIEQPTRKGQPPIVTHFAQRLRQRRYRGERWPKICDGIVAELPRKVYVSVDIDGLDPKLCPDTGTPVPGGLEFDEFCELLRALLRARRRIVGFDLNEVAPSSRAKPSEWGADWNANVGARVLYKLIGAAARSQTGS
jgi:agmatinase